MKLPSLKISLPLIFLCWCVAGVMSHGTVILAYPAMWAVVGLFFFVLHLLLRAPASPSAVETAKVASSSVAEEEKQVERQVSTPV